MKNWCNELDAYGRINGAEAVYARKFVPHCILLSGFTGYKDTDTRSWFRVAWTQLHSHTHTSPSSRETLTCSLCGGRHSQCRRCNRLHSSTRFRYIAFRFFPFETFPSIPLSRCVVCVRLHTACLERLFASLSRTIRIFVRSIGTRRIWKINGRVAATSYHHRYETSTRFLSFIHAAERQCCVAISGNATACYSSPYLLLLLSFYVHFGI